MVLSWLNQFTIKTSLLFVVFICWVLFVVLIARKFNNKHERNTRIFHDTDQRAKRKKQTLLYLLYLGLGIAATGLIMFCVMRYFPNEFVTPL